VAVESSEKRTAVLGDLRATIPSRLPEQDYPSIFKLQVAHFLDTLASILGRYSGTHICAYLLFSSTAGVK